MIWEAFFQLNHSMVWDRSPYISYDRGDRASPLYLASGMEPPSTEGLERGVQRGVPGCASGQLILNCVICGCADSAGLEPTLGWAGMRWDKGPPHVLAPSKEEERRPLAPSTQVYCAVFQAGPPNPCVPSVIGALISHLWPQHECQRSDCTSGRRWVGEMVIPHFSGE